MKSVLFCVSFDYPKVDPTISSACELITSAMKSSLNASRSLRHLRPPGNTSGRSFGVNGPPFAFDNRFGNCCFNSASKRFCS